MEWRGGRGKDGDAERLKAGVGGRLDGLQRWRWGEGGWMEGCSSLHWRADWKGVCFCVCVGGGGTLSKPMGVYIMFYGYEGTHKSLFH